MKQLQEIYNDYLENFYKTGIRPHPDRLLALLLLQDKDNYKPRRLNSKEFYENNQIEITKKINKVITDFEYTKQDIMNYIDLTDIIDYEEAKIWYVFKEGFESLRWGILYREGSTPEEIYSSYLNYFHKENFTNNQVKIKSKKLGVI